MFERNLAGVERLPCDMFHVRIIKVIADERKPDVFHVNPDLMGTACFKTQRNKAVPVFFIHDPIMGDGVFPMFPVYGTFDNCTRFSGERSVDGS